MKIKRLYINNFKSLVNFELIEPNPFSVFVGPNAAGKSNIFEAMDFLKHLVLYDYSAPDLFGGPNKFFNQKIGLDNLDGTLNLKIETDDIEIKIEKELEINLENEKLKVGGINMGLVSHTVEDSCKKYLKKVGKGNRNFSSIFTRLFIGKQNLVKIKTNGNERLNIDGSNLANVLWRILQNEIVQEEITDWLQLLIPGTEKVEVVKSELSGDYFLRVFEKHLDKPIGKDLFSDGTYNILAILTAVYQSEEPQFLCIEEPENGLNPYVIKALVEFMRNMCKEKGHCIWLNTHSSVLVREVKNEEIILVDKKEGITQIKQIGPNFKKYDLRMDDAWLTNSLGGGLPW